MVSVEGVFGRSVQAVESGEKFLVGAALVPLDAELCPSLLWAFKRLGSGDKPSGRSHVHDRVREWLYCWLGRVGRTYWGCSATTATPNRISQSSQAIEDKGLDQQKQYTCHQHRQLLYLMHQPQ